MVGDGPGAVVALGVEADDQATAVRAVGELDAVPRARRVPGVPAGGPDPRRQVTWKGPADPVVVAVLQVGGAIAGHVAVPGVVTAFVVGGREQDPAGVAVHDGGGVAVGVAPARVDDLERAPGAAAVGGAFEHEVDVGGVTAVVLSAFGKGEESAAGGGDEGGDAVAEVPGVLVGPEEDLFLEARARPGGSGRRLLRVPRRPRRCGRDEKSEQYAAEREGGAAEGVADGVADRVGDGVSRTRSCRASDRVRRHGPSLSRQGR